MEDILIGNKFLGEDELSYELYEDVQEDSYIEDNNPYDEVEESSDFEYKPSDDANLYRYFKSETSILEPDRKETKFLLYSDGVTYKGKVLKEIDRDHFIFLISSPINQLKKIDINDISLLK